LNADNKEALKMGLKGIFFSSKLSFSLITTFDKKRDGISKIDFY
jgi:hypothetical protein